MGFFGRTIGICFAINPKTGGYSVLSLFMKSPLQPQWCGFGAAQSVSRELSVNLEIQIKALQ